MEVNMDKIKFLDNNGTFCMRQPENYSGLYFPIARECGLKCSLTPNLGGDSKLDQNAFVLESVSVDDLHNNRSGRNFWCKVKGIGAWSVVGQSASAEYEKFSESQDESEITAGLMWQKVKRVSKKFHMEASVLSYVPLDYNVEVMHVDIKNTAKEEITVTPIAAIPLFGRSADNIRDHRHVTSLLHRIRTTESGVYVKPTLSFDERGHQKNNLTYYVCGSTKKGECPASFYPVVEEYIGEGGTFTHPRAVVADYPGYECGKTFEGGEALGGIRFKEVVLKPGECTSYTIFIGVTNQEDEISKIMQEYATKEKVEHEWERVKKYWNEQVNVTYHTGNTDFDNYMRWVSFQPILRRIYGCSFLPHHDYGKGGRGWRDLWQDCLALLMMNPSGVRQMILDNFQGVRVDGTNATIIGEKQGEFVADRNGITRVWMDHGMWPFMTTKLYIDQTGDIDILNQSVSYFKDKQVQRGMSSDETWDESQGKEQRDSKGNIYLGSVLEHMLLQHLCAFYEVGEHNYLRLRGADWNDALDMAEKRGESVAFSCAYAGNMRELASYLRKFKNQSSVVEVELLEEIHMLLDANDEIMDSVEKKCKLLKEYTKGCCRTVSGIKRKVSIEWIATKLEEKASWLSKNIQENEWVTDGEGDGWFNGYYDNNGGAVEGDFDNGVRMMLTGQVFAIMSRTASREQMQQICKSARKYLYDAKVGGYRLNTDFHEEKYDMGRMFGFAYGEKENGAVFSHMTVMYANALYQNGFVKEGYEAIQTLADTALDFDTSGIYPGVPEYFNAKGKGLYHYLTGAASWYMLTMITEVFGVRGALGKLMLSPKLIREQFDETGHASICLEFAGKKFNVHYHNPNRKEFDEYCIESAMLDDSIAFEVCEGEAYLRRDVIEQLNQDVHTVEVKLV